VKALDALLGLGATLVLAGCGGAPVPIPVAPSTPVAPPSETGSASPAGEGSAIAAGPCSAGTLWLGPATVYPIDGATGDLVVGDINGDGNADLTLGGVDASGLGQVGVMFGLGDGRLGTPVWNEMLPGDAPKSMTVTDFDDDNDLDIVTVGGSGAPELFLNNSDGTFGMPKPLPGSIHRDPPRVVRGGHMGGEHGAVAENADGALTAWFHTDNTFAPDDLAPLNAALNGTTGLAIADFDHDGIADLAVPGAVAGVPVIAIVHGSARRTFASPVYARGIAVVAGKPVAIVAGDFDGNGPLDAAVLYADGATATIVTALAGSDGGYNVATSAVVADLAYPVSFVAGDLDHDGKADLVVGTTHGLAVYRATAGGFAAPIVLPGTGVRAATIADLRGDHLLAPIAATGSAIVVWTAACR
jgi:hypothetical protein